MQFFAFLGVYLLFLATLSPPHPITFSHRWTFGFPRCCLCQILLLLAHVTVPAWELCWRCLGAQLGYCCPTQSFHSVFSLFLVLKWAALILKSLKNLWYQVGSCMYFQPSPPALLLREKAFSGFGIVHFENGWLFLHFFFVGQSSFLSMAQTRNLLTFLARLVKLCHNSELCLERNWTLTFSLPTLWVQNATLLGNRIPELSCFSLTPSERLYQDRKKCTVH